MSPAPKEIDTSTFPGKFAANIRSLRLSTGKGVEAVVEEMRQQGYPAKMSTYYNWEQGKSEPPLAALPALAASLGLSDPHELFVFSNQPTHRPQASSASQSRAELHLAKAHEIATKFLELAKSLASDADCVVIPRSEYKHLLAIKKRHKA